HYRSGACPAHSHEAVRYTSDLSRVRGFMKALIAVVFVLSVCACDKQPRPPVAESSSARASSGILKTVVVPVERKKLHAALKLGSPTNDVRLVQVFRGG